MWLCEIEEKQEVDDVAICSWGIWIEEIFLASPVPDEQQIMLHLKMRRNKTGSYPPLEIEVFP